MQNTNKEKLLKLVIAAMFAALTTVTTIVVQIPSPMNGYVNLGDCFVLLSSWALGPVYGTAAAAIGSMLADVFTGYGYYAPGTFVIKGLMALAAYGLFTVITRGKDSFVLKSAGRVASAVAAEAVMVVGYFLYASLFLGKGLSAAASIPGNLIQAVFGIISAVIVAAVAFDKTHILERVKR